MNRSKNSSYFFLFALLIISCNDSKKEVTFGDESPQKEEKQDETEVLVREEKADSLIFEMAVERMDSLGFNPDDTYFDEKMYQEGKIHLVNYESHEIHEKLTNKDNFNKLTKQKFSSSFDESFSKVIDIRLYPWSKITQEGLKRFGVLERWTFDNSKDAGDVYEFLKNELDFLGFPYPETGPLYLQCKNEVYIFHSPDFGASFESKPVLNWMEEKCK